MAKKGQKYKKWTAEKLKVPVLKNDPSLFVNALNGILGA